MTDFNPLTPNAQRVLRSQGFELVHAEFGPQGSGKTRRAEAIAAVLRRAGRRVHVNDEVVRDGLGGVEIWAAP